MKVVYGLFNVGVFLALSVIAAGQVSMGVGFGLFAVLSIVRLRSEPFSNRELAYFFVALVIGLVCALDIGNAAYAGLLAGVALLAAWAIDHPRISQPARRLEVTLERAFSDDAELRDHLRERLRAGAGHHRVGGRLRARDHAPRGAPRGRGAAGWGRRRRSSLTRSRRSASTGSTWAPPCGSASTSST